jgi:BRCA1-associated protein
MRTSLALNVTLDYGCEKQTEDELNKISSDAKPSAVGIITNLFAGRSGSNSNKCFVASASNVELSINQEASSSSALAAVFVPPAMIEACLEAYTSSRKAHAAGSCFWIPEEPAKRLAEHLLPAIHSSLANAKIRGIILTSIAAEANAPAEIVLLEIQGITLADVLQITNGESFATSGSTVLKILPILSVHFITKQQQMEKQKVAAIESNSSLVIPSCPVCLHRFDPARLSLPIPRNDHLCSKFCSSPDYDWSSPEYKQACPKQRFLERWPAPSRCEACRVIQHYWYHDGDHGGTDEANDLFCGECAMHRCLWVCLTCGVVGCGRYTNKHSVAHFQETNHPYALELATLRIWDYMHGEYGGYAHRVDLLECVSSPIMCHPWIARSGRFLEQASSSSAVARSLYGFTMHEEKAPKKATVIGEEYEVLLQSALEDQAQHYEGEISRLRAELTGEFVDTSSMSVEEQQAIEDLKADIKKLRAAIDATSREFLDTQAQEAAQRATSQRLLREQQEAKELLGEIEKEAKQEAERSKLQVEDLEQQLGDLTANLRIRQQFSQNEELQKAQIVGTTSSSNSDSRKKGKKKSRFNRR